MIPDGGEIVLEFGENGGFNLDKTANIEFEAPMFRKFVPPNDRS